MSTISPFLSSVTRRGQILLMNIDPTPVHHRIEIAQLENYQTPAETAERQIPVVLQLINQPNATPQVLRGFLPSKVWPGLPHGGISHFHRYTSFFS
jgi:hypothetical protein